MKLNLYRQFYEVRKKIHEETVCFEAETNICYSIAIPKNAIETLLFLEYGWIDYYSYENNVYE